MTEESWQAVAFALARRLSWSVCEQHPAAEPDPEGCPFCQDAIAYRRFVAKNGGTDPFSLPTGPSVSVADLRRTP